MHIVVNLFNFKHWSFFRQKAASYFYNYQPFLSIHLPNFFFFKSAKKHVALYIYTTGYKNLLLMESIQSKSFIKLSSQVIIVKGNNRVMYWIHTILRRGDGTHYTNRQKIPASLDL